MNTTTNKPTPVASRFFLAYLLFTALVCGALIMVIEVLGSRVIGPFFGVSLFIWTSLIAVTLISLALGYGIGGLLADKRGTPEYLFSIIIIAGVLVLIIPIAKATILKFSVPLGLRLGSFVSTSLLFGPALFLLGCVSPYLIKIATSELKNLGRTVGGFYALSTVGSVIGTATTGFFLITYLGVDSIFRVVGIMLIILGSGYFLIFRRRWGIVLTLIIPFLLPHQASEANLTRFSKDGTKITLVDSLDSYYGNIKVVDYSYADRNHRELIIDGLIQGGIDRNTGLPVHEYFYFLQFLPYAINPGGKTCLVMGLGAGILPHWYENMGVLTDVVDIDPAIFKMAEKHFDLKLRGQKYVEDARFFLSHTTKQYDYVILDVFNGGTTPAHLLSIEALTLVKQQLNSTGVLGINLTGSLNIEPFMTASVIKTLKQIFDQVDIYPNFDMSAVDQSGNLTVLAYSGKSRKPDFSSIADFQIHPMARQLVSSNLTRPFSFAADVPAIILTDNYNPIDFFDSRLKELVRQNILMGTDWDILLH